MASIANTLSAHIQQAIQKAQQEQITYETLFESDEVSNAKNEFLFFIKPEITLPDPEIKLEAILNVIFEKIEAYNLKVQQVNVLSAKYLDKHNIIAQHYGVINKLANQAVTAMTDGAKAKFESLYGTQVDSANVLGGFEVLKQFPEFNPTTLEYLWQNISAEKLAGGTYCIKVKFDGEEVYVIDGFHPRQLAHFVQKGRSIITFTLKGDVDWEVARGEFIGATNPAKAAPNSLRRLFLEQKDQLGLAEVSQGMNGVHLSAGPIEGLVELIRYNSNFEAGIRKSFDDYDFGKKLAEKYSETQIEALMDNMSVQVNGKTESIFDLT